MPQSIINLFSNWIHFSLKEMSEVIPVEDVPFAGQIDIWWGKKQQYPEKTQIETDYIQWLQRWEGWLMTAEPVWLPNE